MKNIPFLGFLLILAACGRPQTTSTPERNTTQKTPDAPAAYQPDVSFFCKAKALSNNDKISVFVHIELKKGYENLSIEKFITRFSGSYAVLPDYGRKDYIATGSIFFTSESLKLLKPNVYLVSFQFNRPQNIQNGLVILEVSDLQTKQKSGDEILVRFSNEKLSDKFSAFNEDGNMPMTSNFFQVGEGLQIKSLTGENQAFTVSHYTSNFEPAVSPLAVAMKNNTLRNTKVDSVFTINTNSNFRLTKPGLYFFAADTVNSNGISIVIADNRFPRLTRPADLLKPLVYISSNEEIRESQATQDPKKTLDKYWLRLSNGNEETARRNIRQYYRRVTLANQLFTTYKEGWKTDMGMVFTVMGSPNKITKLKDRQVWSYSDNPNFSEINFTFIKRPNPFSENNYELVRYAEYEPIWFPAVEQWRTGGNQ